MNRPAPGRRPAPPLARQLRAALALPSLWILIGICLTALGGEIYWHVSNFNRTAAQFTVERNQLETEHAATVAAADQAAAAQWDRLKATDEALLHDPGWLSGSLARERRATEWKLRLAHDVRYAKTFRETNILSMQQLGSDAALSAQNALEQVARLAAPAGSRVEITPDGDGFRVRVAFMMSRLDKREMGAVTHQHTAASLRAEAQELSSRVLRDLYEYCGSRDIQSISVTCNHTLFQTVKLEGATAEENAELLREAPPVPARLYRVSLDQARALAVADWQRVSLTQVRRLSTVEYDGFPQLKITHSTYTDPHQQDPAGELQF